MVVFQSAIVDFLDRCPVGIAPPGGFGAAAAEVRDEEEFFDGGGVSGGADEVDAGIAVDCKCPLWSSLSSCT